MVNKGVVGISIEEYENMRMKTVSDIDTKKRQAVDKQLEIEKYFRLSWWERIFSKYDDI